MINKIITIALPTLASLSGIHATCTSSERLASAAQIPYAYNAQPLGASATEFKKVPFAAICDIKIYANGAPGIPVAVTGATSYAFALETRQLFSEVTGVYTDFPNGTTIIGTNVTLGVRDIIPVPVTFSANVYLTYDENCQIEHVQAFATVPTEVLGLLINPPSLPPGLLNEKA